LTKYDLIEVSQNEISKACSTCVRGKQVKGVFKSLKTTSTVRTLELLHKDLYGCIGVKCLGNNKYVLVIIDAFSIFT